MNPVWTGAFAVIFGAMTYVLVVVKRRRWGGVGVAALGSAVLIGELTSDTISPAWHATRFWVQCVLAVIFFVCFVMDSRARRSSHASQETRP
jgi:hypothetical protein